MKYVCEKPETEECSEYLSSLLRQKSKNEEMFGEVVLNSRLFKGRAAPNECKVVSRYELAAAAITKPKDVTQSHQTSTTGQGQQEEYRAGPFLEVPQGNLFLGCFQLLELPASLVTPLHHHQQ